MPGVTARNDTDVEFCCMNLRKHACTLLLSLLATSHSWTSEAKDRPSFRANLQQFGYLTGRGVAEYSSLGFLSNDLLLVVVNQRVFHAGIEPLTTDNPPSTLVVFDIAEKQILRSGVMTIKKSPRSVAFLNTGGFLVASLSRVKLCAPDLRCEKSFPNPRGLPLDPANAKSITGIEVPLRSEDVSADGARAVSAELSSTTWHKITDPLGGIDEPTPPNLRRITVYDNKSRKVVFSLQYDPKGHVVGPALSPNGAKLAIVREGRLDVFELP